MRTRTLSQTMIATATQQWMRDLAWVQTLQWPIPIAELIADAGGRIRWLTNAPAGFHGATMPKTQEHFDVWINPQDSSTVQRFTMAHEFAHVLLGHLAHKQPLWWFETEANTAAAELLLPWSQLQTYAPDTPITTMDALTHWMRTAGQEILQQSGISYTALVYHLHDIAWATETATTMPSVHRVSS